MSGAIESALVKPERDDHGCCDDHDEPVHICDVLGDSTWDRHRGAPLSRWIRNCHIGSSSRWAGWFEAEPIPLDDAFAEWGDSRYVRLRLTGAVRLADTLNQLHVLPSVLDESKHYWQGPDEIDKLMRSWGWLANHPEANLVTLRYLRRISELTRVALRGLAELGDEIERPLRRKELPSQERTASRSTRSDTTLSTRRC